MVTYYKILELDKKCSNDEIKKAYHKAALKYHPDKNENKCDKMFKKVVESYEVLSDPYKRDKYDRSLQNNNKYEFNLSPEILKFSRYFFSEENINKFSNITNTISSEITKLDLHPYFEIFFNNFNSKLHTNYFLDINLKNLLNEYRNFKDFYKVNLNKEHFREEKIFKNYFNPLKKNIKFNLWISLKDIYNGEDKQIAIKMNSKCNKCQGQGIIFKSKKKNNKNNKNSKNKKKKKNKTYLDKMICNYCNGTMITKK